MHICTRIALLVAIATVAKCSAVVKAISHEFESHREGKGLSHVQEPHGVEVSQDEITLRDGKKIQKKNNNARLNFGILDKILDFGICTTGTCMSQKDCKNANGTDTGDRCVSGFGVCCVTSGGYTGGDITISGDGGDFFNPGDTVVTTRFRQAIIETVEYKATVIPADDDVQIKVEIRDLNIQGPVEGDCGNDSLIITGTNPGPEVPVLCGVVTNQILYLDVDNTPGPILFTMTITPNNTIDQTWNISISFLKEADAVPRRCLQYFTATEGTLVTFNYGEMINDQTYSICFGYVAGYCNIGFSGMVDLPCSYGYLLIGDNQICGDDIDGTITANATGPINVGVRSGNPNDLGAMGSHSVYTMLGC